MVYGGLSEKRLKTVKVYADLIYKVWCLVKKPEAYKASPLKRTLIPKPKGDPIYKANLCPHLLRSRLTASLSVLLGPIYMGIWVYGYMGIWVYGYMGIWVYGYMGIWVYGYMGIRVQEELADINSFGYRQYRSPD